MANTYCTATNWGKDFFTHEDRNDFYLSGHPGDVWVVGNNAAGVSWINRVSGTAKVKADAQAIVDGKIEEGQAAWDALPEAEKAPATNNARPVKYTLPQDLTMATFKGIKGVKVVTKATDPTASEATGTVWYNSTSPTALKYSIAGAGAWASGGNMTRSNGQGNQRGVGATTAVLAAGGNPPEYAYAETYNGSAWSAENPLNTARYACGMAGTTTAGLAAAGGIDSAPYELGVVEEFDGTSWAESGDLTDTRGTGMGCGTQTAALYSGGNYGTILSPAWQVSTSNEEYNGSSWSEKNNLNSGRNYSATFSAGTVTAAMIAGGNPSPVVGKLCETWNGTSWTEVADFNTERNYGGGFGTSTSAMAWAGENPGGAVTNTEQWNGTSWTEVANVTTAKNGSGGSGLSGTLGISFGGSPGTSATEEWADPAYIIKTVTVS